MCHAAGLYFLFLRRAASDSACSAEGGFAALGGLTCGAVAVIAILRAWLATPFSMPKGRVEEVSVH